MGCEESQYEKICKDEFAEIKDSLERFSQRLFIDNGAESFQSRLNRHDRWMKGFMGVLSAIALAMLGLGVWLIQNHFGK